MDSESNELEALAPVLAPHPLQPDLERAFEGAVFPLSAAQLLAVARENEAPAILISLLAALPQERFESLRSVRAALESGPP